jgi:hypothetical protein
MRDIFSFHASRFTSSQHPLVFRRKFGQAGTADVGRGEMVLPRCHQRNFSSHDS